jgi:uncharacterized membrane protein YoaK (UPF0700 family)
MSTFFTDARQTLVPHGKVKHGPLPPLLVGMTLVTGLVDAFSYLVLGHVFVANMTGNVVFLAFALAGAPGFSILASLIALGAFVLGSLGGGLLGSRLGQHRGRLLSVAAALQTLLLLVATVLAALSSNAVSTGLSSSLIVVLGIAMGLQNATARKLAVPDLTTTVLTLTIVGSLLIFHVSTVFPLVIALIILAVIAGATRLLSRTDPHWVRAS